MAYDGYTPPPSPGNAYTLYKRPDTNGKYTIDIGTTNHQLTNEEYNKLIYLINTTKRYEDDEMLIYNDNGELSSIIGKNMSGGSRRRRPSRKYKKSKRVFRKKSRSTRRR